MSGKIKITQEKAQEIAEERGQKIYDLQTESRKKESEEIAKIYESLGIDADRGPVVPDIEDSAEELAEDILWNLCEASDIYEVEEIEDDDN